MPATRRTRSSAGPAAKGGQSTLSFGNRSRVTKAVPPSSKLSKDVTENIKATIGATDHESESTEINLSRSETPEVGHVGSEAAAAKLTKIEVVKKEIEGGEEAVRAEGLSDAQIKRYWKAREAERKSQRVHQEGLNIEEKVLRLFDMSSQYGPCIGIARMKRWVRANKLGLNPPIEVLAVLLKEEKKGNTKVERAHVDELVSSKLTV